MTTFVNENRVMIIGTPASASDRDPLVVSDFSSSHGLNFELEAQDDTKDQSGGSRVMLPGLRVASCECEGGYSIEVSDWYEQQLRTSQRAQAANNDNIVGFVPEGLAGGVAYVGHPFLTSWSGFPGGSVGDRAGFTLAMALNSNMRGIASFVHTDTFSAVANGSAFQFGAKAVADIAFLAVFSTFKTLGANTIILESDDNAGFTSAITRASISVVEEKSEFAVYTGDSGTDDYWRARISAHSGGDINALVIIGLSKAFS